MPSGKSPSAVKVDGKLDTSLLSLAKTINKKTPKHNPTSQMRFKKPGDEVENQSDALRLADLEVTDLAAVVRNSGGENKAETSIEMTHDFDDCSSANSFTPLPSIQNDYALEIKSFNNN